MFEKYFDANDLREDGRNGLFVRLPTNIPALPSNLCGKVMRADRLVGLLVRIEPLLDLADIYHDCAANESAMARIRALPIAVREGHMKLRNRIEVAALRPEKIAHAYFVAVINAKYLN